MNKVTFFGGFTIYRSHAILTFHVESKVSISSNAASTDTVAKSELRLGKIHLVDLAGSVISNCLFPVRQYAYSLLIGSERLTLSGAEGSTMLETQNINLSLTALGHQHPILYDILDFLLGFKF